jgi:hypothetical protein
MGKISHAMPIMGSPIEASVLDEIRQIYQQEKITFSWEDGDILLLTVY